jgi:hypothetical protein
MLATDTVCVQVYVFALTVIAANDKTAATVAIIATVFSF